MPLRPRYRQGDIVLHELDAPTLSDRVLTALVIFMFLLSAFFAGSIFGSVWTASDMAEAIDQRFNCEARP